TAPLYVHLTQYIPVLRSIRVIVRAGVLFIFAISVLAGFGTDMLLQARGEEIKRFAGFARNFLIAAILLVLFASAILYALQWSGLSGTGNLEYLAGSGRAAYLRSVLAAMAMQFAPPGATVLLPLLWLGSGYTLLWLFQKKRLAARPFFVLLVLLVI